MGWLTRLFGGGTDWTELIENRKAQIVDVRSPGEYRSGHLKNSVNIPLDQLRTKAGKLDQQRPVIVCCASGVRSRMGKSSLNAMGFDAHNGGAWTSLKKWTS